MWIEKEEKAAYSDSKLSGLRLLTQKDVLPEIREAVKILLFWLRKKYFFPIRCIVNLKSCPYFLSADENDKNSYGDFYYDKDDKEYPEIWVATGKDGKENLDVRINRILLTILHELTHYFQWYFFKFEKRADRSLEAEANKWSRYLLQEFHDWKVSS